MEASRNRQITATLPFAGEVGSVIFTPEGIFFELPLVYIKRKFSCVKDAPARHSFLELAELNRTHGSAL